MFRLITSLSLLLTLCINCPLVNASDHDAFAMMTNDIPPQANPATRKFLQGVAMKLKNDWHGLAESPAIHVLATFGKDADKAWAVRSFAIMNVSLPYANAQADAVKLVEKTLSDAHPPDNQPMSVMFVFDTYPANQPAAEITKPTNSTSQPDVDFGPYMASLQRKVRSNWLLEKEPQKNTKAVVVFTINKDGSIKDVHLDSSSSFAEYDTAALNAVNDSAPFLPLPDGSPNVVDIQYTCEYQVPIKPKNNSIRYFTIHLAQPDVVSTEFGASLDSRNFRRF